VVGGEANGAAALARIPELRPDVVTLDIEMPVMDGLEALRQIRKLHPKLRTIMFSTLTTRGASATFQALALGADDYVAKASNAGSIDQSLNSLRAELLPKIRQFFAPAAAAPIKPAPVLPGARPALRRATPFRVAAIGVSTGGPEALGKLFPLLPRLRVPLLVVQHMPPTFTRLLAERLDGLGPLRVVEASAGMVLQPAMAYVAPGDYHLKVARCAGTLKIVLDQGPQENSCRPSVDVLFRSLSDICGRDVLSVVLTGMGSDGLRGTQAIKAAGGHSVVQDRATSVVWGMPGSVASAGLADKVLPLDAIAPEIARLTRV